jgi:two-component system NtrC family sensor kinase
MRRSIRVKLSLGFAGAALLAGAVSLLVGGQLLYRAVRNEATHRIRQDLNAAREIYGASIKNVATTFNVSALGVGLQSDLKARDVSRLAQRLQRMARYAELDFAGIAGADGAVLCRLGGDKGAAGAAAANPLLAAVLERRVAVAGTVALPQEFLRSENPELAERARIRSVPTPRAAPQTETESTDGLVLAAACPIFEEGRFIGALYGGVLVNRNYAIVDAVRDTVFQQETYRGRTIGTATIFLRDLRVSTNVEDPQGKRAVGTRVSEEVRDRVLVEGQRWTDRAFVVNAWYITAYEPIEDIAGERVGMLYVGVLEAKYVAVWRRFLAVFALITALGLAAAIALGCGMADRITRPVQQLIRAGAQVSQGNLAPEIGPVSKDEIGVLQKTFAAMLAALREHERRQRTESETRLLQSEKQASVGRLAAGVAHEINNPLTGVLTFTHLLIRRKDLPEDVRADLQTVARETERVRKIVKGLLDFARQSRLEPEPTDVNKLVADTLALAENQALLKGLALHFTPGEGLPIRTLDRNQLQSALLNIVINAIDATEPGGRIVIATRISVANPPGGGKGLAIEVADTGSGIAPENMDRLFDPFFTTKEVGRGTGLGLSVSLGIIERHGGTIRVESEVGRGSTFTIWLPLEQPNGHHERLSG